MSEPQFLPPVPDFLKEKGKADLFIGLPVRKSSKHSSRIVTLAAQGAGEFYPELTTVILQAEAHAGKIHLSSHARFPATVISGCYAGKPGRGAAAAALLDAGLALDADAILILDSHTQTFSPSWIPALAHLILERGYDLVSPRYYYALPAGALGDLIGFPLIRALWRVSLRQPLAGDIALSPRLATDILDQDVWETEVSGYGFEAWSGMFALQKGYRVAQAAMGLKECQSPRQKKHLHALFQEAVGTLLRRSIPQIKVWLKNEQDIVSLPTLTDYAPEKDRNKAIIIPTADTTIYQEALLAGWMEYRRLWRRILSPENLAVLEYTAGKPPQSYYFPPVLWARIIYDYIVAFYKGDADPVKIMNSLVPLFHGRLASFWDEVAGLSLVGYEGTVAAQAVEFETALDYLRSRWQE